MNKSAIRGIVALFVFIFCLNFANAANCGGATACNCGDNLTDSRTFDGSDNLINCAGTGLEIGTSNLTLDCNGYLINYSKTQTGLGINATGRSNITVTNCWINQVAANPDSHAIYLNSANGIITNNNITTIGQWSDAVTLIAGADNTLVSGNRFNGTASGFNGILLDIQSDSNMLLGNYITFGGLMEALIFELGADNNQIINNTILFYGGATTSDTIYISASSNNNFTGNVILNTRSSGGNGISLAGGSSGNRFYNNFINATYQVDGASASYANYWNTTKQSSTNIMGGSFLGGNYYADRLGTGFSQTCTDANSDGICDSTNSFSVNNVDYLPLANPPIPIGCVGATHTFVCGENITESCTMSGDLNSTSTCFTVNASNIVLDGAGHTLTGTSHNGYGIDNEGYENVTVNNFTIHTFSREIFWYTNLGSTDGGVIRNNVVYDADNEGILLFGSHNNLVENNKAFGSYIGLRVGGGFNNTLTNNEANTSNYGIYLESSTSANIVAGNHVAGNSYGIKIESVSINNVLSDNSAENNNFDGISISSDSTGNNLTNTYSCFNNQSAGSYYDYNDADSANETNTTCQTSFPGGICDNFCVAPPVPLACGDTITNSTTLTSDLTECSGTGINISAANVVLDCDGHRIAGNYTDQQVYGVQINNFDNITVKNCTIYGFNGTWGAAISIYGGNGHQILNNTFYDNGIGINTISAAFAGYNISHNAILNITSANYGIGLNQVNGTVEYNDISVTSGYGIYVNGAARVDVIGNYMHNLDQTSNAAVFFDSGPGGIIKGNDILNYGSGIVTYNTNSEINITENNITNASYGIWLESLTDTSKVSIWHNNIMNSSTYGIEDDTGSSMELSFNSEGNYWGNSCPTLFTAGTDSNSVTVVDSYPYNESNGWLSHGPGCGAPALTCGDTVSTSTTLGSDLGPCTGYGLIIGASDLVIDCAGHNISGDYYGTGYGIYAPRNNVTITNCTIYGFNDTDEAGAYIDSGNSNNILLNTLFDNYDGIMVDNGGNNNITSNTLHDNYNGIHINFYLSSGNTITGNTINDQQHHGIWVSGDSNIITNNVINHTAFDGIYLHIGNTGADLIQNNSIKYSGNSGIDITSSDTNPTTIIDNTLTDNNYYGLDIGELTGKVIYHNNVHNNNAGSGNIQVSAGGAIELSNGSEGNYWGHASCPVFLEGTDSNIASVVDSFPYNESDGWISGLPAVCPPIISSTAPINDSNLSLEEVNYTLSEAVASGTIVFTQFGGGPADPDSPHTCVLQGTALDAGPHSNLALATDANACVSWTPLLSGIYYQVTFDAADALGNNATTVTNTNILFYVTPPTNASISTTYIGGDIAVNSSHVFNVTVNVSCSGSDCGEINVSLDPSGLTLDGNASDMYDSTDSESITISTNSADDIIVLLAGQETNAVPSDEPVSVTSVSGANLTWHKRAASNITGDGYDQSSEIWWAYSQYPLAIETITVNFSGQIDDGVLHIFAVNGANTASPFDANPSLPSIVNSGDAPQTNISTSNPDDFIFAMYGCPTYHSANVAVPSDMNMLFSTQNNGAVNWEYEDSEYKTVSSAQTGLNVGWNDTISSGGNCSSQFVLIADAIQSAVAGKGGLISSAIGASPFWTNGSNPRTIVLNDSESQLVTFWVNASIAPAVPTNYTFFAYANLSLNVSRGVQTNNWTVTVYPIAPIITIDALSTTYNSVQINWSTDEPSNSTLSIGTTLSLGMINISISNFSSGGYMGYSWGRDGFDASTIYYFNITACDINNNCAVQSGTFTTSASPSRPPSTGGSHGGSGGGVMFASYPTLSSLTEFINSLTLGGGYNYRIIGSPDAHKIIIVKIEGKTVTIEFMSTPVKENFTEGETKQIDINGDSVKDIEFTVLKIFDNSINFRIKGLLSGDESTVWKDNVSTNAPVAINVNNVNNANAAPPATTGAATAAPSPETSTPAVETGKINWASISVLAIVLIVLGVIIVSVVRKKNRF